MNPTSRSSSVSSEHSVSHPTTEEASADTETSWSDSAGDSNEGPSKLRHDSLETLLIELYQENITAKICRTATKSLVETILPDTTIVQIPTAFPEIVLQEGPNAGLYEFREPDFWTCGFFPGTIYALLERTIKFPQSMRSVGTTSGPDLAGLRAHLRSLCKIWSQPLHGMASRTDTHDIGFIIMPALQRDWELNSNSESLDSIITAAKSLATRYVPTAGAIRSWDCLLKKEITVTDMSQNLLVIIDSLCNLDLLFYAAAHSGDDSLAAAATTHARTLLNTHLRPESVMTRSKKGYRGQLYSTCHVANICPSSGDLKWRWTAQGYSNESTWARGQAWGILGYAQTYLWTKDSTFLDAACGLAEFFLHKLETAPSCVEIPVNCNECSQQSPSGGHCEQRTKGRYVPLWDFDAPVNPEKPLRDSSAGVIAANGMLILSQALSSLQEHKLARYFLDAAITIVRDTIDLSLAPQMAHFVPTDGIEVHVENVVAGHTFDGVLMNGTANNNENARRRYADHGLVYGDYYLVEFGNRLLSMGLV